MVRAGLGPLRERPFRLLWLGQTTSAVGDSLVGVALAFAVLGLDGSAGDLGLVFAARTVSSVVFVLAGGVWADRLPRRAVMLAADGVRALVQAAVAALLLSGAAEIWHLGVAGFVSGAASAFFIPAAVGLVPDTVSTGRLQQANAMMALSRNAAEIVGPALAGVLVAVIGPGWVFVVDAASYAASTVTLLTLRIAAGAALELRQSFLADLRDGWREITSRTWLWVSLIADSVANIGMSCFYVLGPVVAARELGGAEDWGAIVAAGAIGGTLGSALALRWRPSRPLVTVYALLFLATFQLLALVPPLPTPLIAAASACAYIAVGFSGTVWDTTIQQHVPRAALSRVSAFDWMISLVFRPVAYALVGPAVVLGGIDAVLVGGAVLLAAAAAGAVGVPSVRGLRRLDHATAPLA
jgi:MFS family permease